MAPHITALDTQLQRNALFQISRMCNQLMKVTQYIWQRELELLEKHGWSNECQYGTFPPKICLELCREGDVPIIRHLCRNFPFEIRNPLHLRLVKTYIQELWMESLPTDQEALEQLDGSWAWRNGWRELAARYQDWEVIEARIGFEVPFRDLVMRGEEEEDDAGNGSSKKDELLISFDDEAEDERPLPLPPPPPPPPPRRSHGVARLSSLYTRLYTDDEDEMRFVPVREKQIEAPVIADAEAMPILLGAWKALEGYRRNNRRKMVWEVVKSRRVIREETGGKGDDIKMRRRRTVGPGFFY